MNVHDADPLPPEPGADTPAGEEAAPAAPKRKRAPRKTAAAKPVAEDPVEAAPVEPLAEAQPLVPAAPPPQPAPQALAAPAYETDAGAADLAGEAGESGEPGEPGEAAGPAEGEGGRGARRNRNRRRGRRGADKRGADGAPADGPAEGAQDAAAGAPAEGAADVRQRPQGRGRPVVLPAQAGEVFAEVLAGRFDAETEGGVEAGPEDRLEAAMEAEGDGGAAAEVEGGVDGAAPGDSGPGQTAASSADVLADQASLDDSPQAAPKRVLAAEADAPKLHKVLAQSGAGSRRDLEQKINEGRVSVNGEVAHIGQRISHGDRIAIDGKPVRVRIAPPPARVLAYHKPSGEVVTHDDPQQRPTVFRRLPRLQQGKWQSVGRLDINTEGLLLFTNSGELANQLMHPRFGIEREYAVRSLGTLTPEAKAKLLEGVEIDGQPCAFKSIEDGGGEGVNHWYRCVITEGRNREVRKLFDTVGHAVSRLIRIRYGSVVLPRGLKRGVWVDLDEQDLRTLRGLASVAVRSEHGPRDGDETAEGRAGRGPRNRRGGRRKGEGRGEGRAEGRGEGRAELGPKGPNQRADAQPASAGLDDMPPGFIPDPLQTSMAGLGAKRARPARPARGERPERGPRPEAGDNGPIPNPLQQTYDKRAIQQERALRRELPEDAPIPNPLQQTYDQRALMRDRAPQREIPDDGPIPNPLQQTYDKRFASGQGGAGQGQGGAKRGGKGGGTRGAFGSPGGQGPGGGQGRAKPRGGAARKTGGGAGAGREPDPMQTSVGFIGGDAFLRKGSGGRGGRGGPRTGSGPKTGGGGGAGGPGRGGPRGGGPGKGGPRGGGRGGKGGGGPAGGK